MNHAILHACLPGLVALIVAFVLLRVVIGISGARLNLRRLREVHSCQDGGVQSLAFVVTLPLFVVIVQFIVQVSQLMIGVMAVNYSAYAGARAASVWIPAQLESGVGQNRWNTSEKIRNWPPPVGTVIELPRQGEKYDLIRRAVVLACAPVSPSRDLGYEANDPAFSGVPEAVYSLYSSLAPDSQSNSRIPARIRNKIGFSSQFTAVRVEYIVRNHTPSYKPPVPVRVETPPGSGNYIWEKPWDEYEIDWQDPIRVTVTHHFALLPGPGRFLAKQIVRSDGRPDEISPLISQDQSPNRERVYTTPIVATATMTNDGFKTVKPYVQTAD